MNARIKELWIAALRGGQYQQGRRTLRTKDDAYCCLGVLCDLHAKETGGHWTEAKENGDWHRYLGCGADLPPEVFTWAALPTANPHALGPDGISRAISDLNDGGGCAAMSFDEIADVIAKQFPAGGAA